MITNFAKAVGTPPISTIARHRARVNLVEAFQKARGQNAERWRPGLATARQKTQPPPRKKDPPTHLLTREPTPREIDKAIHRALRGRKPGEAAKETEEEKSPVRATKRALHSLATLFLGGRPRGSALQEYLAQEVLREVRELNKQRRVVSKMTLEQLAKEHVRRLQEDLAGMVSRGSQMKSELPKERIGLRTRVPGSAHRHCFLICDTNGRVVSIQTERQWRRRQRARFSRTKEPYRNEHPTSRRR